ncbi:hypothetical protein HPB50_025745 [Hyalomma asiaticum]|uniref:Uncharacterized protein n=1 Tax=Hyalomma asiaticum TaxID=266040 RepID=A0ACB7TUL0_HYAAI|nr:hypothetical protein HPB50_025745 [Hyalomma asiaticum]
MGHTSRSVLIHFMAEELSPSVKMFGVLYAVFKFRPKVEACLNCRQVGHRRDVCPLPNRLTCPGCGQKRPADHPCTPQCVICGDAQAPRATDRARNASSVATVVRLVHDRGCSRTSSSIRSSSSRRSPSPQSKTETVPAAEQKSWTK